jgi:hypothetical protein
LKERRPAFAITARIALAVALATPIVAASAVARAQGAVRDNATLATATNDQAKSTLEKRFGGSMVDLTTYIGSGTFYASGYHDPYVANALMLRPTYQLGTKYKLSLSARVYLEEEYTLPDNPTGRRFNALDTWLYLAAKNLYTEARSKIRISGTGRVVIPTSFESRYAHMLTAVGVGLSANRGFEFGTPDSQGKRWDLSLSLGDTFTKFIRTSALRGDGAGDSTGCRSFVTGGARSGTGEFGGTSADDRCGGPLNTNFSNGIVLNATLIRRRASLSATYSLINEFKYSAPNDMFTSMNAVPLGRVDATWAILALGYEFTDHIGASLGLSTFQPALNSRENGLRFPLFDFSGTNANNFTQVFVGLSGTL